MPLTARRPRALHRTEDIGSALKGGVNVCQRHLVNEVLGPLLRSSFPILDARARHLFSVAPMPAFSVASRPSNSSDIAVLISIPKHKSVNSGPKNAGRCPKKSNLLIADRSIAFYWASYIGCPKNDSRAALPVLAARDLKNSDGQTSSKNCSLNRDVECPNVGAIFCS